MKFVTRVVQLMVSRTWWLCVWLCVEIALVVALIWSAGPLLAIGATRPLESATVRAWLIALVLLAGCMRLVWRMRGSDAGAGAGASLFERWREHRMSVSNAQTSDAPHTVISADDRAKVAELRARFHNTLSLLRRANPAAGKLAAWHDAVTGRYAYRLPWYLVVGSDGSGKTAVLVHGGLDLSTVEQAAQAAAGHIEATGQCAWWFSNHAVLIDTPGHYLEAADDTQRRGAEWRALLALLRKHRPRQPLNGVLLTVAIDTLLALNQAERAAYATRLRKPLLSMRESFDMQVPIYLCFTRMDRLGGFVEYFSALSREGREQVWGATFPLDETAAPSNRAATAFTDAFDKLAQRLTEGLRDVLSTDPDLDSRALAYLFPQQFASLRDVLDGFCSALFRASQLEPNLVARGIYFASALQSGPAIDRVLAPVRQHLHSAMPSPSPAPATNRVSQSYFLKQLLHEAVFADAGLAGTSRASLRRRLIAHTTLAVASVALLLILLTGWAVSYSNNRAYLDEVGAHVAAINRHAREPITLAAGALAPLAPLLDTVRSLPRSERFEIDAPPELRYGLGLYPGAKIGEASEMVYRRALDDKLLPQAAARLETLLSNAPPDDPEYTYDALKAYLMLHDATHYDGGFVAAWLILDTQMASPSGTTLDQRARLEAHLARLFEARAVASPFALDAALVSRVRERLARDSFAQRAYHQLRRELLRTPRAAPLTVVSAGGPQAALVFQRLSGKPLSDGIDSLYTYRGYWDVFDKRVAGAVAQLRGEEPWVLGIDAAPTVDTARLALEVRRAYFNDYIEVWDAYLNDLTLADSKSIAQSTRIARTLSAPDSPLRQFLQAAARETNLSRAASPTKQRPTVDRLQQRLGEARRSLAAMFGNAAPAAPQAANEDRPEAMVDAHFEPLRRLVASSEGGAAGTAPFDGNLHVVDELYSYLTSASAALNSGNSPPPTDVFDKLQADAGRMPMPLRKMFGDLSQNGSAQVGGALRANLAQDAQGGVGRLCRHIIAGRYPFARNSNRDVALDDFSKLFAPGALMESFFQKNLASQIDVSGSRWRFRRDATGSASGDARLAGSFQNADIIRTAFFSGSATMPALQVELTPLELDPGIAQYTLDVDGQTLRYAHGPQLPTTVKWPSPTGGGQVSLQISTPGGTDGLQTQGPWALHRLLDKARIAPGATPETFVATFDFNGRKLSLRVIANSSYNPFRLPQMDAFSCPS
ncbi:type VI secretion system membrane subunit TssM [Paraburkholderia bryophila]|uniref:Type VI secretion system protein ImpL n=1 Tax=Paraburkholderia bryophila TaxID=420952 RepID=A0A329BHD8_9BURK|nr:type VI secretion system membrane subunit TssM [Paraburkholderia bryophila]RAS21709.1 type VI secretion system protein ImpL [Paraburkholderia bryophila]